MFEKTEEGTDKNRSSESQTSYIGTSCRDRNEDMSDSLCRKQNKFDFIGERRCFVPRGLRLDASASTRQIQPCSPTSLGLRIAWNTKVWCKRKAESTRHILYHGFKHRLMQYVKRSRKFCGEKSNTKLRYRFILHIVYAAPGNFHAYLPFYC